jgi:hypothetical protein
MTKNAPLTAVEILTALALGSAFARKANAPAATRKIEDVRSRLREAVAREGTITLVPSPACLRELRREGERRITDTVKGGE